MTELDPMTHPHDNFQPDVQVQVLRDEDDHEISIGFMVSLAMVCSTCGQGFWWPGMRTGQSFTEPRVTPDGLRALLPMKPQHTLQMASDKLPDIAPMQSERRERQEQAIARALTNPDAYALKLPGQENRLAQRVRAVANALEAVQ